MVVPRSGYFSVLKVSTLLSEAGPNRHGGTLSHVLGLTSTSIFICNLRPALILRTRTPGDTICDSDRHVRDSQLGTFSRVSLSMRVPRPTLLDLRSLFRLSFSTSVSPSRHFIRVRVVDSRCTHPSARPSNSSIGPCLSEGSGNRLTRSSFRVRHPWAPKVSPPLNRGRVS